MKIRKTLVFTTLLLAGMTFGQKGRTLKEGGKKAAITEIVLDFDNASGIGSLKDDGYNRIERGEFFKLRINNVNTYLYDVSIMNKDKEMTAPLPESLLDLVDFGGLKSALGNLNSVSGIVKEFVQIDNVKVETLLENLKDVTSEKEVLAYFDGLQTSYRSTFEVLDGLYNRTDDLFTEALEYQNAITTVEKGFLVPVPEKSEIKTILTDFTATKRELIDTRKGLGRQHADFLMVMETHEELIRKNPELKTSGDTLKKVYKALTTAFDNLLDQLSAANYGKLSKTLIPILNNLEYSYTSLPIQRYEDVNELNVSITPRDKASKLSSYSTILRIPDIEKSFWGVSTGFYLTKNLEQNFSIVERVENGQTLYDFVEEDTSGQELGINTMVRYGLRLGKIKNVPTFWHFGFGAGLTINEKFKPRLMAGTGLAFGHKNKLFVDAGLVHLYYDTLSKVYEIKNNTVLPEDFLVTSTKLSGYVSLGYLIQLD